MKRINKSKLFKGVIFDYTIEMLRILLTYSILNVICAARTRLSTKARSINSTKLAANTDKKIIKRPVLLTVSGILCKCATNKGGC